MDDLDLFEKASRSWEDGTDDFLKLWSKLEAEVRGGCGDSNELYVLVGGKSDVHNECLGEDSIKDIVEEE